ncbi:double-strand break repair helicase AddA [Sphingomonas sp.]|uniref:double-strand break repair helicase AddA n=1 Tax=Sphingomonas sp. TaxID=28214 RepID=UPI00286BB2C8|nr:double-strand break repair helicase AddA [Sphingomonas sp.]
MSRRLKPLDILEGDQRRAADPSAHASLSASAGTGKTHVLTARVFLLLLRGVRPESILCLTFTKAGAAEMANRIGARLASWVRLPDAALRKELFALGEETTPAKLEHARRLFARVLEAPGGLRIQTIHAFAQTLLSAFPAEAEIAPGFRPIEGRAEQELARRTLADLVASAEANGDTGLIADIQALSMRLGEEGAISYLAACARRAEAFAGLGDRDQIEGQLRKLVELPIENTIEFLHNACANGTFDCALLHALAASNDAWGAASGKSYVEAIRDWLALDPKGRFDTLHLVSNVVMTGKGEPRKVMSGQIKANPDYQSLSDDTYSAFQWLLSMKSAASLVAIQAAGLRAGQAYAAAYTRAKVTAGVADFGDLIAWTRRLLETPGMGDWVRFKLDRRTDHILVDEAQDTNADQWAIVWQLIEEYFSGSSETEKRWRSIFMVGDFKQAIFRFQGTDPREFEAMRGRVREAAAALETSDEQFQEFRELSINASFRSSPAILDLVDGVIAEVGHDAMGLPERPNRHDAHHADRPGRVEWWPAFSIDDDEGDDSGDEGWISDTERRYATSLAQAVKRWIDEAPVMASTGRPLSAGDVLILVRSRGELASLIVARLFAERVSVAGIDRLHLHRPLAVKDLLAAVGFAVQPLDDLNLANLLVSPLIGWTQDQLYDVANNRGGKALWSVLQDRGGEHAGTLDQLRSLLAMADYTTPATFLETILSGPLDGRRKLIRRLGPEARDPIEELLSAAIEFERDDVNSLDRFLAWFAQGDVEIKRDPSAPVDAVRVMTVHGAKGLEAPVVILADSTADPAKLGATNPPLDFPIDGRKVPLIRPRKAERVSPFAELIVKEEELDLAEHWRLLYVALTRARERLVIAGVRKKTAVPNSWHARVERAMIAIGATPGDEGKLLFEAKGDAPRAKRRVDRRPEIVLPQWLRAMAPQEERPPRPLVPSGGNKDPTPYPPPKPGELDAARRGTILHLLFERLPGVEPDKRLAAADRWLERSANVGSVALRASYAATVCDILLSPSFEDLFGPESLAEAPIAAVLEDGRVVAGTVDRLLVTDELVRVIDYKTGLQVPASETEVPAAHRRQMEAYCAAVRVIFPGRRVEAALLYTSGPKIITLGG